MPCTLDGEVSSGIKLSGSGTPCGTELENTQQRTNSMRLKTKILVSVLGIIFVMGLSTVMVVVLESNKVSRSLVDHLGRTAERETSNIARDVYRICQSNHQVYLSKLESDLALARSLLNDLGGAVISSDGETVPWKGMNQVTKAAETVALAKMLIGGKFLGQNDDFRAPAPVVDRILETTGDVASIFQRVNEAGDLLRITSTVKGADGRRAIGTIIPARNADGSPNAVVSATLRGERFVGRAFVVDTWYLAAYEPLRDTAGKIIGAVAVATRLDSETLKPVREAVMSIPVGKTGYVYVVGAKGNDRGRYIVSKDGKRDGEMIWDAKDAEGRPFIQAIVDKVLAAPKGAVEFERYPWKNPEDPAPRMKKAAITYFEPWDWVIAAGYYEEDFTEDAQRLVAQSIGSMVSWVLVVAGVVAVLSLGGAWVLARAIAVPVSAMTNAAKALSRGEAVAIQEQRTKDEIGEMSRAFGEMAEFQRQRATLTTRISEGDLTADVLLASEGDQLGRALQQMNGKLNEIVRSVLEAVEHINSGSAQVADASQSLSQGATEQAASLEEITSSTTEIGSQASVNAGNAGQAKQLAGSVREAAERGSRRVGQMTTAMSEIQASSTHVKGVIKAIDDIAFQTNLLALNAAVEAARAGAHGKGFAVVAEEVRNLAGLSAKAAQESAERIEESLQKVETGSRVAQETVAALEEIVNGVTKVNDLISEIAAASSEQAQGVSQISIGLNQIDSVTQQNTANAEETASAAQELSSQAASLRSLLSYFKVRKRS